MTFKYVCTRNCEDIAMSFLVANATGAPPIWVKGNMRSVNFPSTSKFRYICYNILICYTLLHVLPPDQIYFFLFKVESEQLVLLLVSSRSFLVFFWEKPKQNSG